MTFLVSLLVIAALIFIHELGHFLLAKWNNVGVLEFAIGFGKPIFSKRIGETLYSLRMIPLGGYVRMVGDDPRSSEEELGDMAKSQEALLDPYEAALLRDKSRWFLMKGYWAKFSIVLAGPAFNIICAILVAVFSVYVFGKNVPVDEPVIGGVTKGLPAWEAGIKAGDRVESVNGVQVKKWFDISAAVNGSNGGELTLQIRRTAKEANDSNKEIPLDSAVVFEEQISIKVKPVRPPPEMSILSDSQTSEPSYIVGIRANTIKESATILESLEIGVGEVWYMSVLTLKSMWGLIRGALSLTSISGPIFIFQATAESAADGMESLLYLVVLLNVSLAILNLLPIPVLDGGHLSMFTIAKLKGSPISLRVQEVAMNIGMVFIFLLMIVAVGNDLFRLFSPS